MHATSLSDSEAVSVQSARGLTKKEVDIAPIPAELRGMTHPPVGSHDGFEVDDIYLADGLGALHGVAACGMLRRFQAGLAVHHKHMAGRFRLDPATQGNNCIISGRVPVLKLAHRIC